MNSEVLVVEFTVLFIQMFHSFQHHSTGVGSCLNYEMSLLKVILNPT